MNRKSKAIFVVPILVATLVIGIRLGLKKHDDLAPECATLSDYALVWVSSGKTLSFANVDSVTPVKCLLEMSNGWLRDGLSGRPQIVAGNPGLVTAESESGALTLRYMTHGNPTSGFPLVIQEDGTILSCSEDEHTPYGSGRSWLLSETRLVTVDYDSETGEYRVIVFDMQTCDEVDELYVSDWNESISEANISMQGWLAVQRGTSRGSEIVILDSDNKEIQNIPNGVYPTWSPDGEWLAYTTNQELFIVPKDNYDPKKMGQAQGICYPSWSPDGTKLLYGGYVENQLVTRVVDVATQTEVNLPLHIPVQAAAWQ